MLSHRVAHTFAIKPFSLHLKKSKAVSAYQCIPKHSQFTFNSLNTYSRIPAANTTFFGITRNNVLITVRENANFLKEKLGFSVRNHRSFSSTRTVSENIEKYPRVYNDLVDRQYSTSFPDHRVSSTSTNLQNDLKHKCTEFDQFGNVKTKEREFSKTYLCNVHGLQPRDLRKIDSTYANQLPAILVREKAILVNLLHIRALIKADLVVLFDSVGAAGSRQHSLFVYDLQERLRPNSQASQVLPFEFRALESILVSVVGTLHNEMDIITSLVSRLLKQLEDNIDRENLKQLLTYSKSLSEFEKKALNIRGAIEEVLEQDEDLAAMFLSSKKAGTPRSINNHEEIELLLETYLKQTDEIANVTGALISDVRTTEGIVNIILDSQRNSLLLLELQITMYTLSLTMGAFVAALLGMNLTNHFESDTYAFYVVSATTMFMVAATTFILIRRMRKLARQS